MSAHKIKKGSAFAFAFTFMYMFAGFLPLAGIMTALFLYLVASRPLTAATMIVAGIPFLFAVFLIAAVSTLTSNVFPFSAWDVAKDAYFFIAPMLLLVLGLTFIRTEADTTRVIKTCVYALTLATILLYSDFLFSGELANISLQSRYTYSLNSSASTLALLLILSLHPTRSSLFRNNVSRSLLALNLLLIFASLSRVNIAISLVSLIFIYIRSKWVRGLIIIGILLLTMAPLIEDTQAGTMRVSSGEVSFFDKMIGSFSEFRISDYSSMSDINNNWRGYEAYLAIQEVEQAGGIARLIGLGFGSYVVGPFEDKLQKIPFTHNGFVTIYLKAGFLGLIAFALFIFKLFLLARAASLKGRRSGDLRLTRAAVTINLMTISILITTLAAHGVYYSKTTFALFFIGLAVYSLQNVRRDLEANRETDVRY